MSNRIDLTGRVFSRLWVTDESEMRKGHRYWRCVCDCGKETWVPTGHLTSGNTTSCGCFRRERIPALKHGHRTKDAKSPTYSCWSNMLDRCRNLNNSHAGYYIKRGITVCERWERFENFLADMGEQPPRLTLERINNDLGYKPGNCRWATRAEQARNRSCTKLTYEMAVQIALRRMCGEKGSIIAKEYGVAPGIVRQIAKRKTWRDATITAAFLFDLEQDPP